MAGGPATAGNRPARIRLYYAVMLLLAAAEGVATLAAGFLAGKGVFYTSAHGDYARSSAGAVGLW